MHWLPTPSPPETSSTQLHVDSQTNVLIIRPLLQQASTNLHGSSSPWKTQLQQVLDVRAVGSSNMSTTCPLIFPLLIFRLLSANALVTNAQSSRERIDSTPARQSNQQHYNTSIAGARTLQICMGHRLHGKHSFSNKTADHGAHHICYSLLCILQMSPRSSFSCGTHRGEHVVFVLYSHSHERSQVSSMILFILSCPEYYQHCLTVRHQLMRYTAVTSKEYIPYFSLCLLRTHSHV